MLTTLQALNLVAAGKKMRLAAWPEGMYLFVDGAGIISLWKGNGSMAWTPLLDTKKLQEWEEYEEPPKYLYELKNEIEDGHCVRRQGWLTTCLYQNGNGALVYLNSRQPAALGMDDICSKDWIVVRKD